MSNSVIELHDSTIAGISYADSRAIIRFAPAYIHKSEQRPGIDAGTGWVQDACLTINQASLLGSLPSMPANIMDGDLTLDAVLHSNAIPIPLSVQTAILLRLKFGSGERITIKGVSAVLEFTGECKYINTSKNLYHEQAS